MALSAILFLVFLGLLWLAWAFVMFRVLFRLLKVSLQRRDEQNAGYFGWLLINFGVYRDFFTRPEFHRDRLQVMGLTILVFAIILFRVWLLGGFKG